ncbi:MAG: BTAD domain-containing putative transcriptional regulator [Microthrixaceae bacterium]
MSEVRLHVLGPCLVSPDFPNLTVVQRRILTRLALARPGGVTTAELAETLWGHKLPASGLTSLHNQISRIRSMIGAESIQTADATYELTIPTDAELVDVLLDDAQAAFDADRFDELDKITRSALELWRGDAYAELDDVDAAHFERYRLSEVHRSLETLRLEAALGKNRSTWAVPEAERLVAETPGDEYRWSLLIRALHSAGRRGDALGACERARRMLAEKLGLGPSQILRSAEEEVLRSDEDLPPPRYLRFVGRSDLLSAAYSMIEDDRSVFLVGEEGIGKSRVIGEIYRSAKRSRMTVAGGVCPLRAGTPVETLRELCEGLGIPFDPSMVPVVAFEAALRRAVSARDRIVLTVDDIDRAGPTTLEALRVASAIPGVTLVASMTDRTLVGDWPDVDELTVGRLSEDELAALAVLALDESVPVGDELLAWLVDMSGGNPTYLEHLVADVDLTRLREQGDAPEANLVPSSSGLGELVRDRIAHLEANVCGALEAAAVCGLMVPADVLEQLVSEDGVVGALEAGLLSEFRDTEGIAWYRFRHGAVREVLYRDLAPGRRTEIHHRVSIELRRYGAPASVIAAHSVAAVELDPVAASEDAMAAGTQASELGAHHEAAGWFLRAVESIDPSAEETRLRVACLVRYADELRLAGSPDQHEALFSAAESAFDLGDEELIAAAVFAVLQLGSSTGSGPINAAAIEIAERALEVVTEPDQVALIAGGLSLAHSMSENSDLCRGLFLTSESQATSPGVRRAILPFTYLGLGHPDDLEMRRSLTAELLDLSVESGDAVARFEALQLAFSVGLQLCDGAWTRSAVAESASLIDKVGDVGRRWSLSYQSAALAHLDGDLARAEELAEEGLAIFGAVSPSRSFAAYGAQILVIRIAQHRVSELAGTIADLLRDQPEVPGWNAAAALALAESDPVKAAGFATRVFEAVAKDFTWLASHLIGGRAAALIGDRELSRRYVAELDPYSGLGCWQGTCSYGPVDLVLWQLHRSLGNSIAASRHAEMAREASDRLAAPVFLAELDV